MSNKPINLIKKLYIFRVRGGIEGRSKPSCSFSKRHVHI